MGDLQSEEERDIVLELKLPALSSPTQDTVLRSTLSYFNVITSEFDTILSELILSRGGEIVWQGISVIWCISFQNMIFRCLMLLSMMYLMVIFPTVNSSSTLCIVCISVIMLVSYFRWR